jgi:hypothetical protein
MIKVLTTCLTSTAAYRPVNSMAVLDQLSVLLSARAVLETMVSRAQPLQQSVAMMQEG